MASEVKTNKISPATSTTVTLGDASDLFQLPASAEIDIASGATLDVNGTIDVTGATVTGLTTGKILQVVTDTALTANNTTSASFDSTVSGLACLITPASSSNKILVMGSVYLFTSDGEMASAVSLYKNASDFTETYDLLTGVDPIVSSGEGWGGSYRLGANADADGGYVAGLSYLDTANTTNQITYSISGRVAGGSGTVTMGTIRSTTVLVAMEIAV